MTFEQMEITGLLALTVGMFIWDKWRYDLVAVTALFLAVLLGLVPPEKAFTGFSSPVVVTVAAVLVMSAAVGRSGFIDIVLKFMSRFAERKNVQLTVLCALVMSFSAFMNNVGALAIFLPIALGVAKASDRKPSELLMPMAFSSLLGGLLTLIGTPPNLLIADMREKYAGAPYDMFDFAPVGAGLCLIGLLYLSVGWRLLPEDRRGKPLPENQFAIHDYIAEVRISGGSAAVGKKIRAIEQMVPGGLSIIGLLRAGVREAAPSGRRIVREEDVLIVEGDPQTIKAFVDTTRSELIGNKDAIDIPLTSDEVGLVEAVVRAGSELIGSTPRQMRLRSRYGVNVLAVRQADHGKTPQRIGEVRFREGDIIILQGELDAMPEVLDGIGCLPLAGRNLQLGRRGFVFLPPAILAGAVLLTMLDVLPVAIAFMGGVIALALLRVMRLNEMYEAIDWPILVLLGALIPVTGAMEATGMADLLAGHLAAFSRGLPPAAVLALVLVTTLVVTPFLNNAATVLLMAPIAAGLALKSGMNVDPFLMAVAVGASCDFLTPVGHQSNTLVMGPGGYKFADYWRLGLPLSVMVVILGVPLIMLAWPLR